MAKRMFEEGNIRAVANAIRAKNGTSRSYKTSEMAGAILEIKPPKEEQSKSVTITENGIQTVTPDENKVLSGVEIITNVKAVCPAPSGTLDISENGTYDVSDYASVSVNISSSAGSGSALAFKLDGTTHCALIGETWSEWFSRMNSIGLWFESGSDSNGYVTLGYDSVTWKPNYLRLNGNKVKQSDAIVDGGEYSSAAVTISFTIDGVTYQASEDMPFDEWCSSSYNTGGFLSSIMGRDGYANTVVSPSGAYVKYNGNNVGWSNIIANAEYYTEFKMVSFTIGGVEYVAPYDMTCSDWVSSNYNTDKFSISDDKLVSATGEAVYPVLNSGSYFGIDANYIFASPITFHVNYDGYQYSYSDAHSNETWQELYEKARTGLYSTDIYDLLRITNDGYVTWGWSGNEYLWLNEQKVGKNDVIVDGGQYLSKTEDE